ncbi:MAG TPA: hypothetical protein VIF60_17510 [Burkholderiaceae bacterium]|jgi:hypothetical protein
MEKENVSNRLSTSKWLGLALPLLLACALGMPWVCQLAGMAATDVGIANSFVRRLFTSPSSYLPILTAVLAILCVAAWPGKYRLHRSLIAAGIFWGLGLAVMWGFDGGLGNLLFVAGAGMLYFGVIDTVSPKFVQ